nr:MAG: DNA polymerase processivity component [Caudoviricetes sp.]
MRLGEKTLNVLKNFATINSGIAFKAGNKISTVSPQKNILADADIDETIPRDFCIYDLSNFLSVISLFKDGAELEFDDKNILVAGMDGRSKIRYRYTDSSMVVGAPDKRPNIQEVDVSFVFTQDDFSWITKTASVLGSPNIAVQSDGNVVSLTTFDASNDSAHSNDMVLESVDPAGKSYKLVFKTENMKMIPGDYTVDISAKGIAKFTGLSNSLSYFVTLETSSQY